MAENSGIGWTTHTVNFSIGCTKVSDGCIHCYAEAWAKRAGRDFNTVVIREQAFKELAKIKEPSLVFINSLSDLFHRDIPLEFLGRVWQAMMAREDLIFQVLTKRPHRMQHILNREGWPIPEHIWLGTSVENQKFAENRIPALDQIPAPVKWLSCEPLLGPLDLRLDMGGISWVVAGGESGAGRRPAHPDWFRHLRNQCQMAGVPFHFKQGNHRFPGRDRLLDGRTWDEYPNIDHPALRGLQPA